MLFLGIISNIYKYYLQEGYYLYKLKPRLEMRLYSRFIQIILLVLFSCVLNASNKVALEVNLSEEEKNWISNHKVINFTGDPNWLPFEAFVNSGEYVGIVADILNIIEQRTDLKFNKIPVKSWGESVSLLKNGSVDMLTETTDSTLGSKFLFSKPFFRSPIVVIMKSGSPYVDTLSQLKNKKIALLKEYGYVQKIREKYPKHKFYEVENIEEGLASISEGKYDVLLSTMAFGSYNIRNMQLSNINIVGRTEFSTQIGFAISTQYEPLVGIVNKVFKSIDEQTKQNILAKWVAQDYIEKIDYTLIWQIVLVSLLIISGTLFWSLRLKKEIARRVVLEIENKKMLAQQARNAALGEMIDAVAHQWKQPLNAIVMLNELLVIEYKEGTLNPSYLKEYNEDMDRQVEHLLTTLSEFRTFFRPDKEVESFNILDSINSVLILVKDELLKNGVHVSLECNDDITISVIKNEFKHLLLNILNNAKDAFVENNITDRQITIKVKKNDKASIIEVSDNAGGIPEDILVDIFKANVTSKEEGKGTGIGLYMSKQIADKMSAELTAQNISHGALFKLSIPV